MSQNNIFRTMRILSGILVVVILLSESHADAYKLKHISNVNKEIHHEKRTVTTTKKCVETKTGGYYSGSTGVSTDGVNSYLDCMSLCENDKICYGWQYQTTSKSCWLQTSISTFYTDSSYMSGSCIGPADKLKPCKEVLSGYYYNGNFGPTIHNIATAQLCMSQCDADSTCLGWSYDSTDKTCWTQTSVGAKMSSAEYTGGSCIIQQAPYPTISIDTFRQQALDELNLYRKKHCTPALTSDSALDSIAQAYAQTLASTNTFTHSKNTLNGDSLGENLWAISGSSGPLYTKGSVAIGSWYDEINSYNFGNPGFASATGHFTQAVWAGSKTVGFGRALSTDNSTLVVVANFHPTGNFGDTYKQNVLQPTC